ncbi:MAG: gamma-glutamylcyclotransferase family protein [Bryobacteraceae bacterium]
MSSRCIFVYGTLRRSAPNNKTHLFADTAVYLNSGQTLGRLYLISWHPGMIPGEAGEWVRGEVWKLNDAGAAFSVLDEYEGPDYQRMQVIVQMDSGSNLEAWTYFYTGSVEGKDRIESGDWVDVASTVEKPPQ